MALEQLGAGGAIVELHAQARQLETRNSIPESDFTQLDKPMQGQAAPPSSSGTMAGSKGSCALPCATSTGTLHVTATATEATRSQMN